MKVLMINVVSGVRSTGRICTDLATVLQNQGHEVKIAYGRENVPERFKNISIKIGSDIDIKLHGVKSRLFDGAGFGSKRATLEFINWVEEYNPDVIHLHNLHGYYINIEVLFNYLKRSQKKIIWTLHDCWAFTGHCCYYSAAECDKWLIGCEKCPQKLAYPKSFIDLSKENYWKKKELFTSLKNLVLITPSEWLAGEVKKSFMNSYKVTAIPNGIDLEKYRPTKANFKEVHNITNKFMLLGVASVWQKRKGLDDFIKLRSILPERYSIVLIGLSKKQINTLPSGIIGLQHTDCIEDLVDIYSSADIFLNLSVEETMGLTTIEAMACNTPSVVYNATALPEVITDNSGAIVEKHNFNELVNTIRQIEKNIETFNPRVQACKYGKFVRYNEYIRVYEEIMKA